jgi:hypothetical protein
MRRQALFQHGTISDAGYDVSAEDPFILGWADWSGARTAELESVVITARATSATGYNRMPKDLWVEGYDAVAQQWVQIEHFTNIPRPTSAVMTLDLASKGLYSGFRVLIEEGQLAGDHIQILELDFMTRDATNYFDRAGFTDVHNTEVSAVASFLNGNTDLDGLSIDDVKTAVSSHLAQLRIDNYISSADRENIRIPTVDDFEMLGLTGLTEDNVHFVLRKIALDPAAYGIDAQSFVDEAVAAFSSLVLQISAGDADYKVMSGTADFVPTTVANSDLEYNSVFSAGNSFSAHEPQNAFDDNTATYYGNAGRLSAENPVYLGYNDQASPFELVVLDRVVITPRANNYGLDFTGERMPNEYDIEGYDPFTNTWELIKSVQFTEALNVGVSSVAVNSAKAYSGFRIKVEGVYVGADDNDLTFSELSFEVSSIYEELGLEGVDPNNQEAIRGMFAFLTGQGVIANTELLQAVINAYAMGQDLISTLEATLTDETTEITAINNVLAKVAYISSLESYADYTNQVNDKIELTANDLSLLTGHVLGSQDLAVAIERLAASDKVGDTANQFNSLLSDAIRISSVSIDDAYGNISMVGNSNEQIDNNILSIDIDLFDAAEGDQVELVIDGQVVSTQTVTNENLNLASLSFDEINISDCDMGTLGQVNIVAVLKSQDDDIFSSEGWILDTHG